MSFAARKWGFFGLGLAFALALGTGASTPARAAAEPAVQKGVAFLRGSAARQGVGESAMVALALIKAEALPGDATVATCIEKIRKRFANGSSYQPERTHGEVYEAAVVAMALSNLDGDIHGPEIQLVASYLVSKQNANGSWDYSNRSQGDTSITQYAILGLWEAESAGAQVPPDTWDRAASWLLSSQASGGSWNYHRDEGETYPETISMTAAGVGSLLICQRQLARFRRGGDGVNKFLVALVPEGSPGRYTVKTANAKIEQAARNGAGWLGSKFDLSKSGLAIFGQSVYYGLYGIERVGALADKDTLGKVDWFTRGRNYLLASQQGDGSWTYALQSPEMNTAWAILFLTRSTAKTIRKIEIKRLSAGTLVGNRGLPRDLSTMSVAGGRVVSRPMSGAVEGMIAVLEDTRAVDNADAAVAGLAAKYETEGPAVLKPHKDRFRKMITDNDPGVRQVAAWALARLGDLDVVPILIGALTDPDDRVVDTARLGLQMLSRKIDGLGPPPGATPEQRKEAAQKWREWYDAIRPLNLAGQDDDSATTQRSGSSTSSGRPAQ
jgi:hypothetical protein